jgi:creatinine amidohydrolase
MLARYPHGAQEAIADFHPASIAMEKKFRWLSAHRPSVRVAGPGSARKRRGRRRHQASAEKGEQLLEHGARAFCEVLDDVDKFDRVFFGKLK